MIEFLKSHQLTLILLSLWGCLGGILASDLVDKGANIFFCFVICWICIGYVGAVVFHKVVEDDTNV